MDSNRPISEQYRIVAREFNDADAAANMLEKTEKILLSEWILELIDAGEKAFNRAEMRVRASQRYKDYVHEMIEVRKRANRLKLQLKYLDMQYGEWIQHSSMKKAEMRL